MTLNKFIKYGLIALILFGDCPCGNCQNSLFPAFSNSKKKVDNLPPINKKQYSDPSLIITKYEELDKATGQLIDKLAALKEANCIKITPSVSSFTIYFSLLDHFFSSNNGYAYKIEGLEENWNEIKENHIRIYNLPYGEYILAIKGRRYNGVWSSQILHIPIEVEKPYYLKAWFFVMLALSIVGVSFIFFKNRLRKLAQAKEELAYLVALRTQKIEEDRQLIQQQCEKMEALNQTKDKLFAIIGHDLRDSANTFIGLSKKIRYLIENQEWERLESFGGHMEQAANSLHKMLNNLLIWASTQRGTINCQPEFFSLNELIADLLPVYESKAKVYGMTIHTTLLHSISMYADREAIAIILRNLLDNALKFSKAGDAIYLNIAIEQQALKIIVKDEGIGMTTKILKELFSLNQSTIRAGMHGEKGAGLGLLLCKELTVLNHGKIAVKSGLNQGTQFIISFPKSRFLEEALYC